MISIGDYVTYTTAGFRELRGIVVEGPRIDQESGFATFRVMWNPATTPKSWEPRHRGAWEIGANLAALSSMETKCQ